MYIVKSLSFLDRFLALWVLVAMILGVVIGEKHLRSTYMSKIVLIWSESGEFAPNVDAILTGANLKGVSVRQFFFSLFLTNRMYFDWPPNLCSCASWITLHDVADFNQSPIRAPTKFASEFSHLPTNWDVAFTKLDRWAVCMCHRFLSLQKSDHV